MMITTMVDLAVDLTALEHNYTSCAISAPPRSRCWR